MRVKCSSRRRAPIDKTDGLLVEEGPARPAACRDGEFPSPLAAFISPRVPLPLHLILCQFSSPVFKVSFQRFLFPAVFSSLPAPAPQVILSYLCHPHFSRAVFTLFSPFPLSLLIALSLLLSFNFSLSLPLAPSSSPLSLLLCVSFSISDEGNENNRASLILSPVR